MTGMLIVYDADGNVVGTRDYQVIYDPDTLEPIGLADYSAHEENGGEASDWGMVLTYDHVFDKKGNETQVLRDPQPVKGCKVWPEWIGGYAHFFKVELDGPPGNKRIKALVHKNSGHRRERSSIEAAIAERINDKKVEAKKRGDDFRKEAKAKGLPRNVVDAMPDPEPEPADLRDLLGGPDRPLQLDDQGHTKPRAAKSQKPNLPVIAVGKG